MVVTKHGVMVVEMWAAVEMGMGKGMVECSVVMEAGNWQEKVREGMDNEENGIWDIEKKRKNGCGSENASGGDGNDGKNEDENDEKNGHKMNGNDGGDEYKSELERLVEE